MIPEEYDSKLQRQTEIIQHLAPTLNSSQTALLTEYMEIDIQVARHHEQERKQLQAGMDRILEHINTAKEMTEEGDSMT